MSEDQFDVLYIDARGQINWDDSDFCTFGLDDSKDRSQNTQG